MSSQQTIEGEKEFNPEQIVLFAMQRRTTRWCHTGYTTTSVQKRPSTKQK
jgi:hypothetical protein